MPIFGYTFSGHDSAIFGPIGLTFHKGAQERNPSYDAFISFFHFMGQSWREIGRGRHTRP